MTHHDTILYRCMCGNLYDDAGDQPYCPKCKSEKFRAYECQYGVFRVCYACKNEWSGGVPGAAPDPYHAGSSGSPPKTMAPDDDDRPYYPGGVSNILGVGWGGDE